ARSDRAPRQHRGRGILRKTARSTRPGAGVARFQRVARSGAPNARRAYRVQAPVGRAKRWRDAIRPGARLAYVARAGRAIAAHPYEGIERAIERVAERSD